MTTYVAFLRGINVGGNRVIKMEELTKAFTSLKYTNVIPVLATGNIIFHCDEKKKDLLIKAIEEKLQKTFRHQIWVILQTGEEIKKLVASEPFKKITIAPETRLYITFLRETPTESLKIPYTSPEKNFRIIRDDNHTLISVLTLIPGMQTTDAMNIIEKTYGKKVTTRNWNTIIKIAAKM